MGQLVRSMRAGRTARILFRSLKRVDIWFNPFDRQSTSVREFLRRIRTPMVRKENKNLEIVVNILEDTIKHEKKLGGITLTYMDGYKQSIVPVGVQVNDIMDEIEKVARWKGEGASDPFAEIKKNMSRR